MHNSQGLIGANKASSFKTPTHLDLPKGLLGEDGGQDTEQGRSCYHGKGLNLEIESVWECMESARECTKSLNESDRASELKSH